MEMEMYNNATNYNELAKFLRTWGFSERYIKLILMNHDKMANSSSEREYRKHQTQHIKLYKRALKYTIK